MKRGLFVMVALAASVASQRARADAPALTATGIFGEASLVTRLENDLVVRVATDARTPFDGEIYVEGDAYSGGTMRTRVPLRLGPGQTRELVLSVPPSEIDERIVVHLGVNGRSVRATAIGQFGLRRSFIVLADPPRIRAAADALVAAEAASPSPPTARMTVGVVSLERRSGDPRVPKTHFGWAGTELIVASAPSLERLDARGLDALLRHVLAGGSIVIFPGDAEDIGGPAIRRLAGELHEVAPQSAAPSRFLPPTVAPCRYEGPDVVRSEQWGATIARGFGNVHVACFDGNAPEHAQGDATRALLEALVLESVRVQAPIFPQGASADRNRSASGSEQSLSMLRRALDMNEGARPILPLVAIVLVIYVVLVGPVGFRWAERKGRPMLVFVSTPLLAFACLCVLLGAGAFAKGFTLRARSAALVETVAGERVAVERRITSVFFGRPTAPNLTVPPRAFVSPIRHGMSGHTDIDARGERPVLEGFRGGLWMTRMLRTDRSLDMGGGIETTFDGTRLVRVTNHTGQRLRNVIAIDASGTCFSIGDIEPNGRKLAPASGTPCLSGTDMIPYDIDATNLDGLASALGLTKKEQRTLNGMASYIGGVGELDGMVIFARLPSDRGVESDVFRNDEELRLLRVVVRDPLPPLEPTPPPLAVPHPSTGVGGTP